MLVKTVLCLNGDQFHQQSGTIRLYKNIPFPRIISGITLLTNCISICKKWAYVEAIAKYIFWF